MMDVNETCCGNHSAIYINQNIMLYTLNLYSNICQLLLNKLGGKRGQVYALKMQDSKQMF